MPNNCTSQRQLVDSLREQLQYQELRRDICQEELDNAHPTHPDVPGWRRCVGDASRRINDLLARLRAAEQQLERCLAQPPVLRIDGVEQTQAVQFFRPALQPCPDRPASSSCPNNDIKLIAGKATVLRAYVDVAPDRSPQIASLSGVLETRPSGSGSWDLPLTPINAPIAARPVAGIDRSAAQHTLNFRLPASRCRGSLETRLTVFDAAHPGEADYTSAPTSATLRFVNAPPLRIRLIRIRYRNAARGLDLAAPSLDEFWATAQFVLQTYPVPSIHIEADSEELYDGDFSGLFDEPAGAIGTTGSVFTIIDRIMLAEERSSNVKYIALIPGAPANQSGALGWGVAPNRAVGEVGQGAVMAQEIGHTCGRAHAPCGNPGGVDQAYPQYGNYPSGSIGEFGVDVATSTVYDPASSFDFMTYCLNNAWVSPYTYEGLMNCFPAFSVAGEMVPRRRELLYVPCTIFRDGTVKTRGAGFHLQGYLDSYARSTTPYFVELHDEVGRILEARRLELNDPHRSLHDAALDFLAALPWHDDASTVVWKRDDKVLHTLKIEPAAPKLEISSPSGRQPLSGTHTVKWTNRSSSRQVSYMLRYSNDTGNSWRAIATALSVTEYTVDLDTLPGGDSCVFQVLASAGIRTASATTTPFAVGRKPATASIVLPRDEAAFVHGDTVTLFGTVSSGDGIGGEGDTLSWSSSIDGFLGSGSQLAVHTLSAGKHRISLRAVDAPGREVLKYVDVVVSPRSTKD